MASDLVERLEQDAAADPYSRETLLDAKAEIERLRGERDDARNLAVEVAMGVTHSTACTPPDAKCMRCERDAAEARIAELEAERDNAM